MTGNAIHILLVEDNVDHAELLRRNLESLALPVRLHVVEDGETALDYVFGRHDYSDRAQFPPPALVLLDWRLPRLDGVEVLRHVKTHPATATLPVVVLTSSDTENDVDTAIKLRADKFLTKPADGSVLMQLLGELGFSTAAKTARTHAR
jgi:CheY-like chemotaxis protein